MTDEIATSLFTLLDEVAEKLEANIDETDKDQRILNSHKAKTDMYTFLENFFIQFFKAFNLSIDGVNGKAIFDVNDYFKKDNNRPKNVINSFIGAFSVLSSLKTATYHDPPDEKLIRSSVQTYLSELCDSFVSDEIPIKDKISNYSEIKERMEAVIKKINTARWAKTITHS